MRIYFNADGRDDAILADANWYFAIGLPVLLAGTWLGLRLYGRLDEASFRKLVLVRLLLSGAAQVVPVLGLKLS